MRLIYATRGQRAPSTQRVHRRLTVPDFTPDGVARQRLSAGTPFSDPISSEIILLPIRSLTDGSHQHSCCRLGPTRIKARV
jgi:hypothetical protein